MAVGWLLYLTDRKKPADAEESASHPSSTQSATVCCGLHIACEKDLPRKGTTDEIEYYDDEELDAFKGRSADGYSDEEIEQFRDVVLTMLPSDMAGWAHSMEMRGIELPEAIRDEMLMIVEEARLGIA